MEAAVRDRHQSVEAAADGVLDLAEGRIDALFDCCGLTWDLAPAVLIVEEAGGAFFDCQGGHRLDTTGGWFTNGHIDSAIRELL